MILLSLHLNRPDHENILDIELGLDIFHEKVSFSLTFIICNTKSIDFTGELNDVGSAVRVNIPDSFRRGIELNGVFN